MKDGAYIPNTDGESTLSGVKFALEEVPRRGITIKVIGIGGCGSNIVDHMIDNGVTNVEFVCVNTDDQALQRSRASTKQILGTRVTQGHGTGGDPEIGHKAALENTGELSELVCDADIVFLAVGMGGGTGAGAAPVLASLAQQAGALTVAAAIRPFDFEGKRRMRAADEAIEALIETSDTVVEIPNQAVLNSSEEGIGFFDGFVLANERATETLRCITDTIFNCGFMNADLADVRSVLRGAGRAVVGSAVCRGRNAAKKAVQAALDGCLIDPSEMLKSSKVLVNITGSGQFGMHDASDALDRMNEKVADDAELILGTVFDETMDDKVRVIVIASGFSEQKVSEELDEEEEVAASPIPVSEGFDGVAIAPDLMANPNDVTEEEAPGVVPSMPVMSHENEPWFSEEAVDLVEAVPAPQAGGQAGPLPEGVPVAIPTPDTAEDKSLNGVMPVPAPRVPSTDDTVSEKRGFRWSIFR